MTAAARTATSAAPGAGARLPHGPCAAYGLASTGTAAFVVVPQLFLLFFMTDVLAIPAAAAGLVMLVPKLWEFATDPLIGAWSDRLDSRWGRRRPLMACGAAAFLFCFAALFAPPQLPGWMWQAALMLVLYIAATSAYTLFAVPYISMAAEASDAPQDRMRLVSWRMAFVSLGILLAGAGAPWIVEHFGGGREGFAWMGVIVAAASFATMAATVAGTSGLRATRRADQPVPLRQQLGDAWRNRPFRMLWLLYVVQLAATAINMAMLPYFVKYVLGAGDGLVSMAFALLTCASIVGLPLFTALARRRGSKAALAVATVGYAAGLALLYGVQGSGAAATWFYAAFCVAGLANAGQQLLPFSMLTDVINRRVAGSAQGHAEGVLTGLWVAGEKLGLALGAFGAGLLLSAAGFIESGGDAVQPPLAIDAIVWLSSWIPAAVFLASLWALKHFESASALTEK